MQNILNAFLRCIKGTSDFCRVIAFLYFSKNTTIFFCEKNSNLKEMVELLLKFFMDYDMSRKWWFSVITLFYHSSFLYFNVNFIPVTVYTIDSANWLSPENGELYMKTYHAYFQSLGEPAPEIETVPGKVQKRSGFYGRLRHKGQLYYPLGEITHWKSSWITKIFVIHLWT